MVKSLKNCLTVFGLFIIFSSFDLHKYYHPFFVSVTDIHHNIKDRKLEISCKIFTDDFEKTLRKNNKGVVDLLHPKDKTLMNNLITDYIKKHLMVSVNGMFSQLQFVGYEQEEEATWTYFQINNITSVKKIDIKNDLLFDYKKEQINLIHVTVNGKRKSTKLDNPECRVSFEW